MESEFMMTIAWSKRRYYQESRIYSRTGTKSTSSLGNTIERMNSVPQYQNQLFGGYGVLPQGTGTVKEEDPYKESLMDKILEMVAFALLSMAILIFFALFIGFLISALSPSKAHAEIEAGKPHLLQSWQLEHAHMSCARHFHGDKFDKGWTDCPALNKLYMYLLQKEIESGGAH